MESYREFRGTPMPKEWRYTVRDRECSFVKLSSEQANPLEQCIPDNDKILGCYECRLVIEDLSAPKKGFFSSSPSSTSLHTIVVAETVLVSAVHGGGDFFDDGERAPIPVLLAEIVGIREWQDTSGDKHYHVSIKHREGEEYFTFASKQTAKKFVAVLKQAVAQAGGGPLASRQEQNQIVEQISNVVEKVFQWHWIEKNQKGIVYALFDDDSLRLALYLKPGMGVATGRGWLPADFDAIERSILSTFTVKGVPAVDYVLQSLERDTGRFELKVTDDSGGANLALYYYDAGGQIQSITPFRVAINYERVSLPTNTREISPSIVAWILLCRIIRQGKGDPDSIARKLPFGTINITQVR